LLACGLAVADDASIARGKQVYGQLCFNCHGPALDGGIGPSLKDNFWQHGSSPEAILNVINKGIPNTEMIGYEAVFPEADRIGLRDFILSELLQGQTPDRRPLQGCRIR
jgi:mono/diheme cytochrome c family protein